MKKLFFAAIAALVMVSVSNVFANNAQANMGTALPEDTTTTGTVATEPATTDTVATEPATTDTVAPEPATTGTTEEKVSTGDSSAETAMHMFSDSTEVKTPSTDSTNVA